MESNNSKYVTSKFSSYDDTSKIASKNKEKTQRNNPKTGKYSNTSVLNSGNQVLAGTNGATYIPSSISQNNNTNNAFSDISSMHDEHFKMSIKLNKENSVPASNR